MALQEIRAAQGTQVLKEIEDLTALLALRVVLDCLVGMETQAFRAALVLRANPVSLDSQLLAQWVRLDHLEIRDVMVVRDSLADQDHKDRKAHLALLVFRAAWPVPLDCPADPVLKVMQDSLDSQALRVRTESPVAQALNPDRKDLKVPPVGLA